MIRYVHLLTSYNCNTPSQLNFFFFWQIHLIIEYSKGEKAFADGSHIPERSNRFIVSNDVANSNLYAAKPFFMRLESWKCDVLIFTGLHMLDGMSERAQRRRKIREARKYLQDFKSNFSNVPVHFEWASMGVADLVEDILSFIPPHIQSMGMNEEELFAIYKVNHMRDDIFFL